jgi:NAD(P)-dependent dehydrogenase (short-subunit alcohol dehydrogenase family)
VNDIREVLPDILEGRINPAVVTGSSRGTGAGVASRLGAEGARVVVTGRDFSRAAAG